jgi:transposase
LIIKIAQQLGVAPNILLCNKNQSNMKTPNQPAKTREEMAAEYGVDVKTFYRWVKEADIQLDKGRINPAQQNEIYQRFGVLASCNDDKTRKA